MSKAEADRCNLINHIEEAVTKILKLEVAKVSYTLPDFEIVAYDMKNQVIRVDVKLR
jgi:hypothetical protein